MSKTTQAHGVRGLFTPEQASAANGKSEALASRLYGLTEIVKLAAFAAEARRTLTEIYVMNEPIQNCAVPSDNWSNLQDNTGDVLVYVAAELADVNNAFTDHNDELVRLLFSPGEANSVTVTKGCAA
jgi:hypothetical protein